MYRHLLIPTDGSELAERAVTHGVSLAKFVGAKVTVLIVEERVGTVWWIVAEHRLAEITAKYAEEIKKHATSVLDRVANAAEQAGVPCDTVQVQHVQPYEAPSSQRPRTGAAISSSWDRTDAADYPQLCLAV